MSRVNQFFRCLIARLNQDDKRIIEKYLSDKEQKLLYKLPVYDIKHCVNVASDVIKGEKEEELLKKNIDFTELVRAALLHDIGKSIKPLNPIDKSLLVILNKITKGRIKKYEDKSRKIYIYFNHGKEGYKLLIGNHYSEEFLNLIRDHHDYEIENQWLKILRKYDDMN